MNGGPNELTTSGLQQRFTIQLAFKRAAEETASLFQGWWNRRVTQRALIRERWRERTLTHSSSSALPVQVAFTLNRNTHTHWEESLHWCVIIQNITLFIEILYILKDLLKETVPQNTLIMFIYNIYKYFAEQQMHLFSLATFQQHWRKSWTTILWLWVTAKLFSLTTTWLAWCHWLWH